MSDTTKATPHECSADTIFTNVLTLPGVKVNRRQFLAQTFAKEQVDLQQVLEHGPVQAGCTRKMLKRIADRQIMLRTSESSAASFIAGLPGGWAMALSIPADVAQFFAMTLRLAQELTYLYGGTDLWIEHDAIDAEAVRSSLMLYCGVMFGVSGAAAGVRMLSAQLAQQALKKLPQKALTKTVWYNVAKRVGKAIGIKITKSTVAKGVSKVVPIIGGVVSGGLNFVSMHPMAKRLAKTLDEANFDYSEAKLDADCAALTALAQSDDDAAQETDAPAAEPRLAKPKPIRARRASKKADEPANDDPPAIDPFTAIEKLHQLQAAGAITQEEYDAKKTELLKKI